ncbi:HAD-IA family hydrolase [Sphingomonas sp. BK580]|uniref:HAD-IA family hydrolase n=1 Tax=Sphingomonas sp. BK580 TaxID=2586972 RepID=UPI0016115DD9|nr:HAD-IA family hydrolase [Sphingomonas sp. BK580]MBB3694266.1 phosphoglycolate phosphatase [Sphingomonas sp. BK580]
MSPRLAVFDCDGTLVDSQANICRAMEAAFAGHGLPAPARESIRGIVGLSLVEAMAVLAPAAGAARHAALAADYKTAFQRMRAEAALDPEPLYDGLVDALDALATAGWRLGVATGKSDRGLALLLAHHGLTERFVTLQTADRHPSKPHPSMLHEAMAQAGAAPHMTVMIGDTSFDMTMARAAGVRAVGVTWGYHREEALWAAGAQAVARRCDELAGCCA